MIIDLRINQIDFVSNKIRIRGKGDKDRIVFMRRKLNKAIRNWLRIRGKFDENDRLFVTKSELQLSKRNVARIIERLKEKSNSNNVRCSPHTLRHTGATFFIQNGGDPFSLKRILGHSNVSTPMVYAHMAGKTLQKLIQKHLQ